MPRRLNNSKDFWQLVDLPIGRLDDCWLWLGYIHPQGYGMFKWRGKDVKVHRLAYELTFGPVADGMCVMHICDIRHCCSPRHLRLGTIAENNADRHAKGRDARAERNGRYTHPESTVVPRGENAGRPRGEQVGSAKLTANAVCDLRRLYATGAYLFKDLAAMYGVTVGCAQKAVYGRNWAHVLEVPPVAALRIRNHGLRGDQHWSRRHPERRPFGARNGAYTHPQRVRKGEHNGRTRLTADDVRAIRSARLDDHATLRDVAARYGVTPQAIHNIVKRKTWKHIP